MNDNGIFFVTCQQSKALYSVIERRELSRRRGITADDMIKLKGQKARHCPILLRRIGYTHPETGKHPVFLTNNLKLAPKTIADIYKARWKIELILHNGQEKSQNKILRGHLRKCRHEPNLDRDVHVSASGIPQVLQHAQHEFAATITTTTAQLV